MRRLKRTEQLRGRAYEGIANKYREMLVKAYGPEKGRVVKRAEVFGICEYGGPISQERLKVLFPFFPE